MRPEQHGGRRAVEGGPQFRRERLRRGRLVAASVKARDEVRGAVRVDEDVEVGRDDGRREHEHVVGVGVRGGARAFEQSQVERVGVARDVSAQGRYEADERLRRASGDERREQLGRPPELPFVVEL